LSDEVLAAIEGILQSGTGGLHRARKGPAAASFSFFFLPIIGARMKMPFSPRLKSGQAIPSTKSGKVRGIGLLQSTHTLPMF
jgi:hypothetical protein